MEYKKAIYFLAVFAVGKTYVEEWENCLGWQEKRNLKNCEEMRVFKTAYPQML